MPLLLHHLTKALKNYIISQITKKKKKKQRQKEQKNSHHVYWYHKIQQDYVELLLLFI